MILYLTLWFPKAWLGRSIALFQASNPLAVFVGAPASAAILGLDSKLALHGWQWLFLLEGLPACLLAFAAWLLLTDGPAQATWLNDDEKKHIASRLHAEDIASRGDIGAALRDGRVYAIGLAAAGILFCQNGVQLWAPQIVQALGFSNLAVGAMLSVPAILAAAGMVAWGYSSDKHGERIWHLSLAALFTATGLLIAAISDGYAFTLVGLAIAIIGQFAAMPVSNSIAPAFLRGAGLASAVGLYNTFAQLGGFFGAVTMGVLKQQTGGFAAGLVAFALAISLTAVVALALGRAMAPRAAKAVAAE
jgi:ACS family tartrate transporter-like MFS transporter